MNVLAVALAHDSQRFVKGFPPKGARLLLQPNIEIMRLAALLRPEDSLHYVDERVDPVESPAGDVCLVHVGFGQENRARDLRLNWPGSPAPIFFGPQVTSWRDAAPEWCRPRVIGDITEVWSELRADAESRSLKPRYWAAGNPGYVAPRQVRLSPEMDPSRQTIQFVRGCFCPAEVKQLCPEYLYCGNNRLVRTPEEVIGEVITLPRKRIHVLDEDVAALPDYYHDVFRRLWNHRRQWVVNASDRLFDHPRLIRLLAKAGTKAIHLNDTFLRGRLERAVSDHRVVRQLYRRVKSLQAAKMLVGARLTMPVTPDEPADYERIASVLHQIDLDFVETRFVSRDGRLAPAVYRPMITASEPGWIKNRFYSIETIADRVIRRPRRVGFFTTAVYLLPYSMAYRQDYLEGLP